VRYLKTYENKDGITFKEWLETNEERFTKTSIICSDSNLIDLDGIEDFKKLEFLDCSYNKLTKLPDLSIFDNLKFLDCSYNKLTKIPDLIELKDLYYIDCHGNNLPFNCDSLNNLREYLEWHKKEYPWVWDAKKYNL
jgi:Leucine-rich repeat (LRR) protein